jgi:CPA1 family monovalent cation:H+ antiporter
MEAAREKLMEQTDQIDSEARGALGEDLDLEEQQIHRALGDV